MMQMHTSIITYDCLKHTIITTQPHVHANIDKNACKHMDMYLIISYIRENSWVPGMRTLECILWSWRNVLKCVRTVFLFTSKWSLALSMHFPWWYVQVRCTHIGCLQAGVLNHDAYIHSMHASIQVARSSRMQTYANTQNRLHKKSEAPNKHHSSIPRAPHKHAWKHTNITAQAYTQQSASIRERIQITTHKHHSNIHLSWHKHTWKHMNSSAQAYLTAYEYQHTSILESIQIALHKHSQAYLKAYEQQRTSMLDSISISTHKHTWKHTIALHNHTGILQSRMRVPQCQWNPPSQFALLSCTRFLVGVRRTCTLQTRYSSAVFGLVWCSLGHRTPSEAGLQSLGRSLTANTSSCQFALQAKNQAKCP